MTEQEKAKACPSAICHRAKCCAFPFACISTAGDTQAQKDDAAWTRDMLQNGWTFHEPRWFWRVWGVRHVRFVWHLWRAEHAARLWSGVGIGVPVLPAYDRWVLHAILRGWA
jgi:hypothetical protein